MEFRLCAVRVFVNDWDRALAFYTETLGIPSVFASAEMGWAELATGEGKLALERASDAEARALAGRFVGVSLAVDDIEATYRTLTSRGVEFMAPPATQPWGGTLAHFKDPDGNVLTLLGSSDAAAEAAA